MNTKLALQGVNFVLINTNISGFGAGRLLLKVKSSASVGMETRKKKNQKLRNKK